MNTIYMVKVTTDLGVQYYYAGAETEEEALLLAAENDHTGDNVEAKQVINREGIQPGDWRFASIAGL